MANTQASRVERAKTIRAGIRRAIIIPVTIGTTRSQGVILYLACNTLVYVSMSPASPLPWVKPSTVNAIRAMVMEGTVERIRFLICSNRGTPQTDDAMTVVSERGEILSPK